MSTSRGQSRSRSLISGDRKSELNFITTFAELIASTGQVSTAAASSRSSSQSFAKRSLTLTEGYGLRTRSTSYILIRIRTRPSVSQFVRSLSLSSMSLTYMLALSLAWYRFIGRVLGKALYEGILVDVAFAGFFLAKARSMLRIM